MVSVGVLYTSGEHIWGCMVSKVEYCSFLSVRGTYSRAYPFIRYISGMRIHRGSQPAVRLMKISLFQAFIYMRIGIFTLRR